MPDMEKVMRGLECCCTHIVGMSCGNCPYEIEQREDEGISDCTSVLAYDAIGLIKEQQEVIKTLALYSGVQAILSEKEKPEIEAKTVIKIAKRFNDCDLTGYCPFCSRPLIKDWAEKYCGYCGNPVLWEGR